MKKFKAHAQLQYIRDQAMKKMMSDVTKTPGYSKEGHHLSGITIAMAENPETPHEIMRKIADHGNELLAPQLWLGRNKAAPPDVLEKLGNHPNEMIRSAVAGNPSTPFHVLKKLAGDINWVTCKQAIENPSMPVEHLEKYKEDLADGPDRAVTHLLTQTIYMRKRHG